MNKLIVMAIGSLVFSTHAFAKTDLDNDGNFSKNEVMQSKLNNYTKKFAKADANSDGKVSLEELKGVKLSVPKAADHNLDGYITKQEVATYAEKKTDELFEKKDANRDGMLSKDERKRVSKKKEPIVIKQK